MGIWKILELHFQIRESPAPFEFTNPLVVNYLGFTDPPAERWKHLLGDHMFKVNESRGRRK